MQTINPAGITKPASNYSQGVVVDATRRRVLVSGQCGVSADGNILSGTKAQMRQAFENVIAVVEEAGLTRQHIIKVTVYLVESDDVGLYREVRDEMLQGHTCASTLLIVAGLAHPDWTVEIEAEACD